MQLRGKAHTRYSREAQYEAASLVALHMHETPVLQFQPDVAVFQCAQTGRDHECSTVLHKAFWCLQDGRFGFHVDRTSGLIEQKNGGVFQERTGEEDALAFSP